MVEVSLTILTTTISTIIVVTMTTIFFCCWRKKGSGDIVAGKTSKPSPTKEEFRKERSASPTSVAVGRPENGVATENQSSQTLVDSNEEDLGDFSAVQRETEILRSYRKPPPPKNRARQSRAPRQVASTTANLDIFTELSEEDGKNEDSYDKENMDSCDDAGRALLRTHSKEKTQRDTRSSMLADIEQTLAALYMSDQNTAVPSEEGSLSEDKTRNTESISKVNNDIRDEKSIKETDSETHKSDLISENKSSPSPVIISPEISVEPVATSITDSPKPHHIQITTPKLGPKVSPKPSPRFSARFTFSDGTITGSPVMDKHADIHENKTLSSLTDSADTAVRSIQCPSSQTEAATTDMEMIEETTVSGLHPVLKSTHEISTNNVKSPLVPLDNTGSDVLSIPTDTIVVVREEIKSEDSFESFNGRSETAGFSDATGTSEYPLTDVGNDDTVTEFSGSITTKSCNTLNTEEDAAAPVQSGKMDPVSNGKETDPLCDEALHSVITGSTLEPRTAEIQMVISEGAAAQVSPDKETAVTQLNGSHDGKARESGKEQGELNEDQTGKGKISKIPVRSGSKPRSSPP